MINYKKKNYWNGIVLLSIGTIVAQVINFISQPVLTRIVSPSQLGIYTYIVSLATIIIPIASLKLDMLIVTEKNDDEAQYITDTCILIVIFVALTYYVFIVFIGVFFRNSVFNKYGILSWFAPLLVLTNGIRFLFISYNTRYKEYKLISIISFLREFGRAVIQIIMGVITRGAVGQVLGYAVAPILGLNLQIKEYLKKKKNRGSITLSKILAVIKKGKKQICYIAPAQLINSISSSIITISITALFSSNILGYYSVSVRVLEIPIVFITANVSRVIYQRISEKVENKESVHNDVLPLFFILLFISFLGFLCLYLIAPNLTEYVFGRGYGIAGEYIKCLCFMYGIRFVVSSFSGIFTIFNKQQYELLLNACFIVWRLITYGVSYNNYYSIIQYLRTICVGYSLVYIFIMILYFLLCYKYEKKITE